jgi:ABC-type sugar transport system ATPase subunit
MVEIARAIYREADLLILDEPSAGLDARSRQQLLATLKGLVRHGTTVVLVTHDMDDLRGIADKVIEIRDGRVYPFQVDTCLAGSTDAGELPAPGNGSQLNVSVRMPSGQTLRVSGQLGRATVWHFEDALERALTARGLVFCDEPGLCRVDVDGLPIAPPTPQLLREHGIRLLLADRRTNGVFADLTVLQNYLVISGYPKRLIGTGHARELAQQALAKSNVSYPSVRAPVSALSGGNQQRLLWAALAASDSRFIVAEEPLLGLDAQARQAMLNMLREMADSGRGVLVLTCFPRSYPGHEVNAPGRAK